jgi:hypothetical protein
MAKAVVLKTVALEPSNGEAEDDEEEENRDDDDDDDDKTTVLQVAALLLTRATAFCRKGPP